jgi:hypothetical protein
MQNRMNRLGRASAVSSALLMSALLWGTGSTFAEPGEHNFHPPEGPGPYSIGHTTVVITDLSRNPDGSVPASSAGRPLFLHIWYPTTGAGSGRVIYTWNNPVYNQNPGGTVYPGLPDLPALTFPGSASAHPVSENAPLSKGIFPLLVATHGNEVAAAKNMPDTLETLASHGYIVASVEHTGNDDAFFQASFVEGVMRLPLGPNPSLGSNVILQRSKDVSFTIDEMLQGGGRSKNTHCIFKGRGFTEHRRFGIFARWRNDAGHRHGNLFRQLSGRQTREGGQRSQTPQAD